MIVDSVIDSFVDTYDETLSLLLLKCIALPEQGGLGYQIKFFNPSIDIDGYETDHALKVIRLDTHGVFSAHSPAEAAAALKSAVEVDIAKTHAGLLERIGWGTGKVVLGVIETVVGLSASSCRSPRPLWAALCWLRSAQTPLRMVSHSSREQTKGTVTTSLVKAQGPSVQELRLSRDIRRSSDVQSAKGCSWSPPLRSDPLAASGSSGSQARPSCERGLEARQAVSLSVA